MKKLYTMPATQEQSITMCQLMAGSYTPGMTINNETLNGTGGGEGTIYGD